MRSLDQMELELELLWRRLRSLRAEMGAAGLPAGASNQHIEHDGGAWVAVSDLTMPAAGAAVQVAAGSGGGLTVASGAAAAPGDSCGTINLIGPSLTAAGMGIAGRVQITGGDARGVDHVRLRGSNGMAGKMIRTLSLAFIVACMLVCCGSSCERSTRPLPIPEWNTFAQAHCPRQCEVLTRLGCPEAKPSCASDCVQVVNRRLWTPDDIQCVEDAGSVAAVRECRIRCKT
jgi:hypothetical protein